MWFQVRYLWGLWLNDGLRSIGALIPLVSAILLLRAFHLQPREQRQQGTWWGLGLSIAALLTARIGSAGFLSLHLSLEALSRLPGLLLFAFVSGVVLLLEGVAAWRRAWFPIALLLCVNPVPHTFTHMVDLPLQYVGAHTANAFASWLHIPLEGSELRLMFSPSLGMFIAPGCNGLRGAVTMGYLALIVGYLCSLPAWLWTVYTLASVLLAYLLNLVRLCGLVLCYKVALSVPYLARHMAAADYALGSVLFFSAAFFLFTVPRQWTRSNPHSGN